MKKQKLTIVEQVIKTTATQEVNGSTIRFMYESNNGNPPMDVAFLVTKGQSTNAYAAIDGVVSSTGHFEVRNNHFEASDIDLYKEIHATANTILHPEGVETEPNAVK